MLHIHVIAAVLHGILLFRLPNVIVNVQYTNLHGFCFIGMKSSMTALPQLLTLVPKKL